MRAIARRPSGVYEAECRWWTARRGIYAYSRVGGASLYAVYGVSKHVLLVEWLRTFAGVLGVLGATSLTGFGLARSATRSVEAEAAQAALAFNRRLLAEANKTAQAREMMLRELNHRVKNSLQMIRSLVRLQAQRPGGPDLDAIVSRVMAIASIHDLLYRSASSFEIDLAGLLEQILSSDAIVPPESHVVIERRLERLTVDANVATPLALCTVELVTNAAKHAFGPEGGRIEVTLRREGARAVLTVSDDGGGLPEAPARNSGLRVVDALVLQLGGALRVLRDGGARFEIDFPLATEGRDEEHPLDPRGDEPSRAVKTPL
jgi:two-component sensor histidine kinase